MIAFQSKSTFMTFFEQMRSIKSFQASTSTVCSEEVSFCPFEKKTDILFIIYGIPGSSEIHGKQQVPIKV